MPMGYTCTTNQKSTLSADTKKALAGEIEEPSTRRSITCRDYLRQRGLSPNCPPTASTPTVCRPVQSSSSGWIREGHPKSRDHTPRDRNCFRRNPNRQHPRRAGTRRLLRPARPVSLSKVGASCPSPARKRPGSPAAEGVRKLAAITPSRILDVSFGWGGLLGPRGGTLRGGMIVSSNRAAVIFALLQRFFELCVRRGASRGTSRLCLLNSDQDAGQCLGVFEEGTGGFAVDQDWRADHQHDHVDPKFVRCCGAITRGGAGQDSPGGADGLTQQHGGVRRRRAESFPLLAEFQRLVDDRYSDQYDQHSSNGIGGEGLGRPPPPKRSVAEIEDDERRR